MQIHHRVIRFARQRDFVVLKAIGAVVAVVVGLQLLWPVDRPLPLAKVNGRLRFIRSEQQLAALFSDVESQEITLQAADKNVSYRLKNIGVSVDQRRSVAQLYPSSPWASLIPFRYVWALVSDHRAAVDISTQSIRATLDGIAQEVNIAPVNAAITINEGLPLVVNSVNARQLKPSAELLKITMAIEAGEQVVGLNVANTPADITTDELQAALDSYIAKLPPNIDVTLVDQVSTIDRPTLLTWLGYRAEDSRPIVSLAPDAVNAYASEQAASYSSQNRPTTTFITLSDGKEVSRVNGSPGKGISAADLAAAITHAADQGQTTTKVALVSIASPIEYIRTYTRSQAGLQALLNDLVAGKDMSIKYVDLTSGWSAGANANKESFMASTYKLFVVYSVLRRVDAGTMHMNDDVIGFSLDTCLHKIIIDSNNECSIALAEKIGWTVVQNEGRALGASGLNWSETINGTVSDAAVIPLKLARDEILSPASRTYLLDLMKAQRFRSGIPAGTPYAVADKVGFYEGWLNDTGIVYAGATPYVLAIYSNGQSWNTIADATRRIEQLML